MSKWWPTFSAHLSKPGIELCKQFLQFFLSQGCCTESVNGVSCFHVLVLYKLELLIITVPVVVVVAVTSYNCLSA